MSKSKSQNIIKEATEKIKSQPAAIPMQETKPVKPKASKEDLYHLNAFVPRELVTDVKIKLLREGKTLTDLIIEKLEEYRSK